MRKHTEMSHSNKGYNLVIVGSIPTSPFSKYKLMADFSTVI